MKITNQTLPGRLPGLLISITLLIILLGLSIPFPAAAGTAVPNLPHLDALQAKAAAQGQVRIIVGLNVPFTPEGELEKRAGPQAVQSQQQAIRTAQSRVWQQLAGYNSQLITNFKYIPAMVVAVDAAALNKLASLPEVANIEEDQLSAPTLASSIPIIGADTAWAAGFTGAGQAVAILDTGVDKTHSYFQGGKVVSEACYSTTYEPYGSTTVCPNGTDTQIGSGAGIDCTAQVVGSEAEYNCTHGTHVAGIAAGNDNTGPNFGVAKDANIISIQVYSYFSGGIYCDNCALSYSTDQIRGLERVYELRNDFDIAAVNMSLGDFSYSDPASCDAANPDRKAAIDNLRSVGIATVIASGNGYQTNEISAPACISSAISVGATDDADDVASFSNVASFLDLFAPGVLITSSVPGGGTSSENGTSMATPHVAGAWAVLRSFAGSATIDEILAALKDSGTLVDDNRTGGSVTGIPRINVDLALNNLSGAIVVEKQTIPDGSATAFTFSGDAAGTISDGEQIVVNDLPSGTYSATEAVPAGWELTSIVCDDANSSGSLVTNTATFHLEAGETITCTFTNWQNHTLTVNTNGSGSVTAVPNQTTFRHGETVELTATANPGWTFSDWSGDASSSNNPISLTMDSDKTVNANFTQDEYTLTVNVVGSGSVTVDPDLATYHYGDAVTLTAVTIPGWAFSDWSGDVTSAINPLVLTMTGSKTITATFMAGEFTLGLDVVGNGAITAVPDKVIYNGGEVVDLTAVADPGWTFSDWSGDVISTSNPVSLTMDSNKIVTATFTQNEYTLSVNTAGSGSGSVTINPDQATYHYGDEVVLTAVANPGTTFSDWSGDVISASNPVTLTITGNQAITATFTQDEYTLTLDVVGQGSATAVPDQTTYLYGDVVTLTAVSDPGWTFSHWSGAVIGSSNPVTLMMTGDQAVTATFSQDAYTLALDVTGNGSITAVPNKATYHYGDEVTLTAVASPGWTFSGWHGHATGANNPFVLTITGDQAVTADFSQDEYTLTIDLVGGGTVTAVPDKAVYNYGDVVELTAVDGPHWVFSEWSGAVSSTGNPIILTMTSDETLTATFIPEFKSFLPFVIR